MSFGCNYYTDENVFLGRTTTCVLLYVRLHTPLTNVFPLVLIIRIIILCGDGVGNGKVGYVAISVNGCVCLVGDTSGILFSWDGRSRDPFRQCDVIIDHITGLWKRHCICIV